MVRKHVFKLKKIYRMYNLDRNVLWFMHRHWIIWGKYQRLLTVILTFNTNLVVQNVDPCGA